MTTPARGRPISTPAPRAGAPKRLAFCPVCGGEQMDKPVSQVASPEAALCAGRCTDAWHVLLALRLSESSSTLVADRRRLESEAQQPHAPTLSQILLDRWRAGDWAVAPEHLIDQL